jgi:hypothetical protein
MDKTYETNLFNGVVLPEAPETTIPIEQSLYSSPGQMSGKINEYRLLIEELQSNLYDRLLELEKSVIDWNTTYPKLLNLVEQTEADVNDRLFLRSDSEGFFKVVSEAFTTIGAIDNSLSSNVYLDAENHLVRLSSTASSASLKLTKNNYSLAVRRGPGNGTERIYTIPGSSIDNLYEDNQASWMGTVVSRNTDPVSVIIEITFAASMDISHVILSCSDDSARSSLTTSYLDEYDTNYPIETGVDMANSNVILINKKAKKIYIMITKNFYSERIGSTEYRYLFNIRRLQIFKSVTGYNLTGTYVSKPTIESSSKLALEVCDFTGDDTNISYSLSLYEPDTDNLIATSEITPVNKPPGSAPYGIWLSNAKTNNVTNPNIVVEDKKSTNIVPLSSIQNLYSFKDQYKALNHKIMISQDNINSIAVFSNYKNEDVEDIEAYSQVGSSYQTWVYIESDTRKLNVGNSKIRVEGLTPVNGVFSFNKTGWFKVIIPLSEYFNTGKEFESLTELKDLDVKFPYNGKYLIEGTNITSAPYLRFEKRARAQLRQVNSLEELDENSFYLMRSLIDPSSLAQQFYIVVSPQNNSKNLFVEYRGVGNLLYSLRLTARLKSNVDYKTPILASYKIKLGD